MSATKVTIVRVEEERSRHSGELLMLLSLFSCGIAVGIIAVLFGTHRLSLPLGMSTKTLVGAVADSDAPLSVVPIATSDVSPTPPPMLPIAPSPSMNPQSPEGRTRSAIDLDILDRSVAIERLNQEIERKKNASIALIADFEKNCGNWSDVCATTYQAKLDAYNSDYESLVDKLSEMKIALDVLRAERAALDR
jgi:hypothetical protein